jgi:hypothetical protein
MASDDYLCRNLRVARDALVRAMEASNGFGQRRPRGRGRHHRPGWLQRSTRAGSMNNAGLQRLVGTWHPALPLQILRCDDQEIWVGLPGWVAVEER